MTITSQKNYNNSMRLRKETRQHLLNLLINNSLENINMENKKEVIRKVDYQEYFAGVEGSNNDIYILPWDITREILRRKSECENDGNYLSYLDFVWKLFSKQIEYMEVYVEPFTEESYKRYLVGRSTGGAATVLCAMYNKAKIWDYENEHASFVNKQLDRMFRITHDYINELINLNLPIPSEVA